MPPPLLDLQTISYQMPGDVLVRILFRRLMSRSLMVGILFIYVIFAIICLKSGGGAEIVAYFLLCLAIAKPIGVYLAVTRVIRNDSQLTDPKTVEFGPSRIVVTGPNWKNEMPWTRFKGFSEDSAYFYLHLSKVGMASIVPKSAFTMEQLQLFRQYGKTLNA